MPPPGGLRWSANPPRRSSDRGWRRARRTHGRLRAREAGDSRIHPRSGKTSLAGLPGPRSTKDSGSTSGAIASHENPGGRRSWHEILGRDSSRPQALPIHYNGQFFDYPLRPLNALRHLGPINALRIVLSYVKWHYRPYRLKRPSNSGSPIVSESGCTWCSSRPTRRKSGGMPCAEIRAEWAAQRIEGLSLARAILNATAFNKRWTRSSR